MRSTSLDEGGSSRPAIAGRGHRPAVLPLVAVAVAAASSAVLVGHDGSTGWRLVRVVVVLAVAAGAAAVVPRRGVGIAALGGGALVVAVGAGFLPHLVKRGATPVGVAALAAVLAGLVLVGASVVRLGGRRWPRRVGAAAAGLVITGLTALVVGPAVAATNVPRPDIGADPSSVGLDYEEVELPADAGVRLAAWYVPTSNGAAVVLRHGAGSTRSSVLRHAAVLAEHGYGVLLVDARGHGRSTGRAMDFGWWGDADVAAAVEHLAGRAGVDADRIGVVGLSMGGEEAVGATAALPQIRAVVAEGATARSAGDEAWLSGVHGVRGWLQEQLEVVQDWVTGLLTEAPVPIDNRSAVAGSEARYLLVAAGEVPEEVHTASDLEQLAPDRVEVWVVEGAGHTDGLAVAPEEWERRVIGFLDAALAP